MKQKIMNPTVVAIGYQTWEDGGATLRVVRREKWLAAQDTREIKSLGIQVAGSYPIYKLAISGTPKGVPEWVDRSSIDPSKAVEIVLPGMYEAIVEQKFDEDGHPYTDRRLVKI